VVSLRAVIQQLHLVLYARFRDWRCVRAGAAGASLLRLLVVLAAMPFSALAANPSPVHAATIAYPDLEVMVPTAEISIGKPTSTTRELRFSHVTWNAGAGPLEIRPSYDPSTGVSQGFQRLYTYTTGNTLQSVQDVPIADPMVYVPALAAYKFPLSTFGLYAVAPDGSVGSLVAPSPKTDFCIAEDFFVGGLPNTPATAFYDPLNCGTPTGVLGLSVGWGDKYDYTDAGENIDITNVPDGTYWLRAIADPDHQLQESDTSNNITDTRLTISGTTVTVLSQSNPGLIPPTVTITSPAAGSTVSGTVALSATASGPSSIQSVQFLVDGQAVGPALTSAPYTYQWDSSAVAPGAHLVSAQATDAKGLIGTAPQVSITTSLRLGSIVVDQIVSADGNGTVTTTPFSTSQSGEVLLALGAADAGAQQTLTISGAGLAWSLVKRANAQLGTAEAWTATAASPLNNVTVTSTEASGGFSQSLTVVVLRNATGVGASAIAGASSGAPAVKVTTTAAGSWVLGVGNDWANGIARTLGPNQEMLHQFVDGSVGNTYWAQAMSTASAAAGTTVTLNDTAPTADRWNFVGLEVLASGSPPPPDTTPPSVSIINPVSGQTLSGSATVAANANDNVAVASVQFLLDGQPLGAPVTASPYSIAWDTTKATNGTHTLGASATDTSKNVGTAALVSVTVTNPAPPTTCFIVDVSVFRDGTGQVTTPAFHTALPNELLLAFVASDGPSSSAQTATVSGAGLTWTLVKRANTQAGTAEIWSATAASTLSNVSVTSKQGRSGFAQSLTVIAIQGTSGTGAAAAANAPSGAPMVTLSTTKAGSLVYGVGNDWDQAIPRTLGLNQIIDHQWANSGSGDTFWVQHTTGPAAAAGSAVTLSDTAPTTDRWNFAAVEVRSD